MELLNSSDLNLQTVVERVRKAAVVDDDVLARDKVGIGAEHGRGT